MKVSVPKEFGNTTKKPVLPLVPKLIKSIKKEDITTYTVIRVITTRLKSSSPSRDWMEIMKRLARFSSGVATWTEA